jgi:hypothetical protein
MPSRSVITRQVSTVDRGWQATEVETRTESHLVVALYSSGMPFSTLLSEALNPLRLIPKEHHVFALGAAIAMLAFILAAFEGNWQPQLFWIAVILAFVAIAKRAKK